MKRRLSLTAVALFAMVSFASLNAKDPDPYQNSLDSAKFTTFNPAGNFSLQASLALGESIEARNASGVGFVYAAKKPGVYSFLANVEAGTVDVYWGGALQDEKLAITTSKQTIWVGGKDLVGAELQNAGQKQGIYDAANLLKNPGFETVEKYIEGFDPTVNPALTDVRSYPADWKVNPDAIGTGSVCRANNIKTNSGYADLLTYAEGDWAFMLHNLDTPLWQQLDKTKLKPASYYKVSYRQMGHKDTSPSTDFVSYILTDSVNVDVEGEGNKNVIASYSYKSPEQGYKNYKDVTYAFKTPDVLPSADMYLVIRKTGVGCINNFDRMTLQEIQASDLHLNGVISAVKKVTWEDGLTVPVGGETGEYEDVTSTYLANPGFETTAVTLAERSLGADVGNSGVWVPSGWTVAYSATANKADQWDQGLITSGLTGFNHDPNVNKRTDTGYTPTEGENFYYFRTRWVANQDFTMSQTIKNLQKGRYDLNFSAAADVANPAKVSLNGGVVKSIQIVDPTMKGYTLPFNLMETGDIDLSIFVSRIADSQARLALDNFQLIYRGEVDNEQAVEEMQSTLEELQTELDAYTDDMLPNGVLRDKNVANELAYSAIANPVIENLQEAIDACKKAIAGAKECGDMFIELGVMCEAAAVEVEDYSDYPDYDDYSSIILDDAGAIVSAYPDAEPYYYAADVKNAMDKIVTARRAFFISGTTLATETSPIDLTNALSSPSFTKLYGDPTSDADRSTGDWVMNNIGGGDYKLHTVNGKHCWNNWSSDFTSMDVYQILKDMPEGMYVLECVTTTNGVPHDQHAYITTSAGTAKSPVSDYQYTGDNFATESEWQTVKTTEIYAPKGSDLRLGFASTSGGSTSGWFCVTDFKLTYYKASANAAEEALAKQKELANTLLTDSAEKVMGVEKKFLEDAIQQASNVTPETMAAAFSAFAVAIDTAEVSISRYNTLGIGAVKAEVEENLNKSGYTEVAKGILRAALDAQNEVLANDTTTSRALTGVKAALQGALKTYRVSLVETATPENPIDVTFLIENPTCVTSDVKNNPSGWEASRVEAGNDKYANKGQHWSGDVENYYLDVWNATPGKLKYTVKQTLNGIPNGTYILKCAARSTGQGLYLMAIEGTDTLTAKVDTCYDKAGGIWADAEIGSAEKEVNTGNGYGWNWITINNIKVEANVLTIGLSNEIFVQGSEDVAWQKPWNGTWLSADDFQLFCTESDYHSSIDNVGADEDATSLKVYVENGYVKVIGVDNFEVTSVSGAKFAPDTQLAPGFYVVTAGTKTAKIVVE